MTALRDARDAEVPDSAQTRPTRIVAQSRAFRKVLCPFCEQRTRGGHAVASFRLPQSPSTQTRQGVRTPRSLRWQAAGYTMLTPIVNREPALHNTAIGPQRIAEGEHL